MNNIQSTVFALLMTFSLAFTNGIDAKQPHKQSHAHSKSHKHASHSSKHAKQKNTHHHKNIKKSSSHYSKNTPNKNQHSTAKKVNHKAGQTLQNKGNNNAQANISPSATKHIQDRHWHNANQGLNTSRFNQSMTDQKLSKLAAKTINQGSQKPSTHGQGRSTYQYRFDKPIGTTSSGQKANSLRVVTDAQNNVITAFPVK